MCALPKDSYRMPTFITTKELKLNSVIMLQFNLLGNIGRHNNYYFYLLLMKLEIATNVTFPVL